MSQVVKWIANGITLERNPDVCRVSPKKKVSYVQDIDGNDIRITPVTKTPQISIEVAWSKLNTKWKNWLWSLYINDTEFVIQTHMQNTQYENISSGETISNTIDTNWTVMIDDWKEDWNISGIDQTFDIVLTLKRIMH